MGEHVIVNGRELNFFDLPPKPTDEVRVTVNDFGDVVVEHGEPRQSRNIIELYRRKMGTPEKV